MTPESMGFLMERLFDAGALDVVFCPIHMKKNRPGIRVEIIGRPGDKDALMNVVLRESTSIGVRFRYSTRMVLERRRVTVESPWGAMPVKEVIDLEGREAYMPEFEECRKVALERNIALKEIFAWVNALGKPWRR
jgi:hypothetical protein